MSDDERDVEAERRVQGMVFGMKQQADQLMMATKYPDAIRFYRELLMNLTRSQVNMAVYKDLVISCRMNVLAAMSKLEQWHDIPPECELVFSFLREVKTETQQNADAQILGRLYYFRGFALSKTGALAQADQDFRAATQLLPDVESIQNDWKSVQNNMQVENHVKTLLHTSMTHFQADKYTLAAETCHEALKAAEHLENAELTGLIHGNLASAYSKAEMDQDAIKHYKAAIDFTKKSTNPQKHDRMFDLLDGLTTCYMRQNDLAAALRILNQSVVVFPKCKDRQDREVPHFLNVGRICFALNKFDEAEKHFARTEKAAMRSKDPKSALHAMHWLGRVYLEQREVDKLAAVLEKALPMSTEQDDDDTYDKFLVLWLSLMKVKSSEGALDAQDEKKLDDMVAHFAKTKYVQGQLRAMHVLASVWRQSEAKQTQLDELLKRLDDLNARDLVAPDSELFADLILTRVERCLASQQLRLAKALLADGAQCIKRDDASAKHAHDLLLVRFAQVYLLAAGDSDNENEDEDMVQLEKAVSVLRTNTELTESSTILADVMTRIALWEARQSDGQVAKTERLLEESVQIYRKVNDDASKDRFSEALAALCILQVKKGNKRKAQQLMKEIESMVSAATWGELKGIREQIEQLDGSSGSTATSTEPGNTTRTFWDQWWFSICLIIIAILSGFVTTQE
ncbi:hypothetical protein Poli38472_005864 [Pythium oligandrum]|uniref:Tetratricopeptide repeat protein 29 n=1 Tax=Pythium oligandrum TaxID=41045 RepID=A0A8K1CTM3_PYTOL|nr:hypothetical protein Poli38472_005864 [Pythium oligandrum]|eukprot:TMW68396.1 hypothetical protein Poli38472_005864 [Pythium oligandrum]